jgi:hypothetical protein
MRTLAKPDMSAVDVFVLCVNAINDAELQNRLRNIEQNIQAANDAYEAAAPLARLHTIPQSEIIGELVTTEEMSNLYDRQIVARSGAARHVYQRLRLAPTYGMCPLCGVRVVATIDHHLPKSRYPDLAITPVNLVPCCMDCNTNKRAIFPTRGEEETLHPYYDDFDEAQWVKATLLPGQPPAITFTVEAPHTWPEINRARVRRHFTVFKLEGIFQSFASQELVNLRYQLARLFEAGGPEQVRGHLREQMRSYQAVYTNSWQGAMYQALLESDWFCEGGLQDIPG